MTPHSPQRRAMALAAKDGLAQGAADAEPPSARFAFRFEFVLQSAMVSIFAAGLATMQARQLLITQTAQPLGEASVTMAVSGLATAYSLGSLAELFLSPSFGKLSDRIGRKPVLLSLLVGPAIMRSISALVQRPMLRIRMLWLDFALARVVGIQPTVAVANTMISDVFPPASRPAAYSRLRAAQALGSILGNYASGWWNARAGPKSTYIATAAVPTACFAALVVCLPETGRCADSAPPQCGGSAVGGRGAFATVLADRKCRLLSSASWRSTSSCALPPPISTVSVLFMRERLRWGPLQAGRFASGVALATFVGSLLVGPIRRVLGERREGLYVSLAHSATALAYAAWRSATSSLGMAACLFPMALGSGASPVVMAQFLQRAQALGLARGEASAVLQAVGAVGRILAPQLFLRLWLAASRRAGRAQLPLGAPMLAVAGIVSLQEALHRCSCAL